MRCCIQENRSYLDDLLSYGAVGARSVGKPAEPADRQRDGHPRRHEESNQRRPSVMLNSVQAAQASHIFLYRGCDVTTSGNPSGPYHSAGRCG